MNDSNIINVLWTGGWDSTFRMIQATRLGCVVQPYYVIDAGRQSSLKEIKQMHLIKNMLSERYPEGEIKDIKIINLESICIDERYKEAARRLRDTSFMGSQYTWLAQLSWEIDGLELCIHKDDKAEFFVRKLVDNKKCNVVDKDIELIFGGLNYPILEYTKLLMEEECKKWGDLDIINLSWFCFSPINETPCGICNPCQYSLAEGMERRFDLRGKIYGKFPRPFGFMRRLLNRYV